MARMKRRLGVTMFVSSPVQLDQLVVEEAERMQFCGTNASYFCFVGGGAPSPGFRTCLKAESVQTCCTDGAHTKVAALGRNKVLNMMYNMPTNRYVLDKSNIIKWRLSDFGPYKDDSGELLLITKTESVHSNRTYEKSRYSMINGERFFHTRDVVKIITRGPPTIIDMIDKVTTPFQLASGRWVPVGLIERSIEGDQSVILNAALFGSSETTSVILLVWLNNDHKGMREDEVLRYVGKTPINHFKRAGCG